MGLFARKPEAAPEVPEPAPAPTKKLKKAAEPPQYVTRQQLDTLVSAFAAVLAQVERAAAAPPGHMQSRLGYRLALVAGAPAEFGLSSTEAAVFKQLVSLIDGASANDGARDRRRAGAPNDEWRRRPPPI
jgi:hypothetical protein